MLQHQGLFALTLIFFSYCLSYILNLHSIHQSLLIKVLCMLLSSDIFSYKINTMQYTYKINYSVASYSNAHHHRMMTKNFVSAFEIVLH